MTMHGAVLSAIRGAGNHSTVPSIQKSDSIWRRINHPPTVGTQFLGTEGRLPRGCMRRPVPPRSDDSSRTSAINAMPILRASTRSVRNAQSFERGVMIRCSAAPERGVVSDKVAVEDLNVDKEASVDVELASAGAYSRGRVLPT